MTTFARNQWEYDHMTPDEDDRTEDERLADEALAAEMKLENEEAYNGAHAR
jgi:hypothetical protein